MTLILEPADGLTFGVYPGGIAGDDLGGLASGPADDPDAIIAALDRLQHNQHPFTVRGYRAFTDSPHSRTATPADLARYLGNGRRIDLVVQYQSDGGDVAGYVEFLRQIIAREGAAIATVQVTEEPNVGGNPTLDGYYPQVREALVAGVLAAKSEAVRQGLSQLRVGFNTTPLFGPDAGFIGELVELGGPEFLGALDYVGIDFFPDVFRPMAIEELHDGVTGLLTYHREQCLSAAGIDATVPILVTENGWPTGPERTCDQQAEVVDIIVRAIAACRGRLNIAGYSHFSLRDADSANPGLFHQFGLMRDDYTPKPAFETYRSLIAELGRSRQAS